MLVPAAGPLPTAPPATAEGLPDEHVTQLLSWADELEGWIR